MYNLINKAKQCMKHLFFLINPSFINRGHTKVSFSEKQIRDVTEYIMRIERIQIGGALFTGHLMEQAEWDPA